MSDNPGATYTVRPAPPGSEAAKTQMWVDGLNAKTDTPAGAKTRCEAAIAAYGGAGDDGTAAAGQALLKALADNTDTLPGQVQTRIGEPEFVKDCVDVVKHVVATNRSLVVLLVQGSGMVMVDVGGAVRALVGESSPAFGADLRGALRGIQPS